VRKSERSPGVLKVSVEIIDDEDGFIKDCEFILHEIKILLNGFFRF
jgi:hypothetical protein